MSIGRQKVWLASFFEFIGKCVFIFYVSRGRAVGFSGEKPMFPPWETYGSRAEDIQNILLSFYVHHRVFGFPVVGDISRCSISFSHWLWLLQVSFARDCWNFIFENLNSANPLINSDIWFYLLFYSSKKFSKCLFSAWNGILLRKNKKWDLRGVLIISGL